MNRRKIAALCQALMFLPLTAAVAIVDWQAQGDGFTAGGLIAAGLLCIAAAILVDMPYRLPGRRQKERSPLVLAHKQGPRSAKKHHKNRKHHTTAA